MLAPFKTNVFGSNVDLQTPVDVAKYANVATRTLHIAFILDASDSMFSIKQQAISGFNEHVAEARRKSGLFKDVLLTLVHFNSEVYEDYFDQPLDRLADLTNATYQLGGMTALYDAMGYTIGKLSENTNIGDLLNNYLVITITDGHNNNSRHFTPERIKTKIEELQKNRWTFVYVGANQDLYKAAQEMSMPISNMMHFAATAGGIQLANDVSRESFCSYMESAAVGDFGGTHYFSPTDEVLDTTNQAEKPNADAA